MTMTMTIDSEESNLDDIAKLLKDRVWRLTSGKLYKIIVKGDDDDEEVLVLPFVPNRAQRRLMSRLHNRNLILKARQLGFTTLISILWLDTALFSVDPIRCGIIAQDKEAAESIFRDKVKFAYKSLPDYLKEKFPVETENKSEIVFAHNHSSIRVATSMRSGTIHRLHISEFGKICAKYPDKAREVVTGSIPAVPLSGMLVIESTAEGQDGEFYAMTERSKALHQKRVMLTPKDYRFHFFAWWEAPEYELDPEGVIFTEVDLIYFNDIESKMGRTLSDAKRAWWVATRDSDFGGDASLMWQEYPSTPEEAFQVSTDGCYYAAQLALARKQGRIHKSIPLEAAPVNTFWDLGRGDATAIWFHQRVGMENRFVRYYEASGEDLSHYVVKLQSLGMVFGTHYVPHDAEHRRLGITPDTNKTLKEMLEALMPGQRFQVVPRITNIGSGIQATRNVWSSCHFDESTCGDGLKRLANYKKEWDKTRGCWRDQPRHDENSHGADAFRQFGQEADGGNVFPRGASTSGGFKRRGSAMAV
jgi:hypothetical protein